MGGFKPALQPLASSGFIDLWRDQPWLTFVERTDDPRWGDRTGYLRDPDSDPVATSAWEYVDRNSYRTNSYPRPAVALRTLAAVVGQDAFVRGMRHYSLEWRYRHPYPDDFFKSFNEGSGQDVSWYFEDLFRGTATLDWSVSVSQDREAEIRGAFQAQVGGEFLIADKDQEPATSEEERPWIFDVVVRRKGTLRLPCRIEVNFEDGGKRTFDWSREDQALSTWYRLPLDAGMHKVTSVVIDPERLCYLDTDMSDNQWHLEEDELLPLRWSERVLTQYAHLLHWFAATGG